MNQILERSFDFSIRTIELVNYLGEEKKLFPLHEHLLACAMGMGIALRLAAASGDDFAEHSKRALSCAVEKEYLLEIMVKTGYLQEKQSRPIMSDCRVLKMLISEHLRESNVGRKAFANQRL